MTWAGPLAFGWIGLGLAILAFYWLRPGRQQIQVASVLLWRRMLESRAERTWLDWLKRHLLLILQLLVVAALALTLARPECQRTTSIGPPAAVVIDASLSMRMTDVLPSRLEAAQARAIALVRDLPDGTRISVVEAGGTARPVVIGSTDRREIESAIAGIRPSVAEGQVAAALDLGLAIAPAEQGGAVTLFTDGSFELPPDGRFGEVRAVIVGDAVANLELEDFAVRRRLDDPARIEATVAVRNHGPGPARVAIAIHGDARVVGDRTVGVAGGERLVAVFGDLPPQAGYEARIVHGGDAFPLDDRAFAELAEPRPLDVLVVGGGPEPVVRALLALPGVRAAGIAPEEFPSAPAADVYVFQEWVPEVLPRTSLVLARPPEVAAVDVAPPVSGEPIPLVATASPLLRFLNVGDLPAAAAFRYPVPSWARPALLAGDDAVLAHGVSDGRRVALVGLDITAPDTAAALWYPILWRNVLAAVDPFNPLPGADSLQAERPITLVPHPLADRVEITGPDGQTHAYDAAAAIALTPDRLGAYVIRQFTDGELLAQSRATLDPPPGAGALARGSLLGGGPRATPAAEIETSRIVELWPLFAVIGLVLLMAEWWWFHRVRGLR